MCYSIENILISNKFFSYLPSFWSCTLGLAGNYIKLIPYELVLPGDWLYFMFVSVQCIHFVKRKLVNQKNVFRPGLTWIPYLVVSRKSCRSVPYERRGFCLYKRKPYCYLSQMYCDKKMLCQNWYMIVSMSKIFHQSEEWL